MVAIPFVLVTLGTAKALAACSSIEVQKEWRSSPLTNKPLGLMLSKLYGATSTQRLALFFPFHRYFVWPYTEALKSRCGYTGVAPYWNWTIANSPMFSTDLGPSTGDPANDYTLPTGAFNFSSNFTLACPVPHSLRRSFTLEPYVSDDSAALATFFPSPDVNANATFTPAAINAMTANYTGDFKGFQKQMEGFEGLHGSVHEILGGDLAGYCPKDANEACFEAEPSPTYSANEPIFWMHHVMVDRVWLLWQNAHPNNTYAFEGASVQNISTIEAYNDYPNGAPPMLSLESVLPTDGILFPEQLTLNHVWITEGDVLCYTYAD